MSLRNTMKLTIERFPLGRTIEQLMIERGVKRPRQMAAGCSTRTSRGVPAKVSEPPAMRPGSGFAAFLDRIFALTVRCPDFTSLFTTLISLAQQYFRVIVRRRLGERPWAREGTILRSEAGVGFRANGGGG